MNIKQLQGKTLIVKQGNKTLFKEQVKETFAGRKYVRILLDNDKQTLIQFYKVYLDTNISYNSKNDTYLLQA